jgi:hypothetical protein
LPSVHSGRAIIESSRTPVAGAAIPQSPRSSSASWSPRINDNCHGTVMTQPTVLITGISGFIARHCALELLSAGYAVRGTVR